MEEQVQKPSQERPRSPHNDSGRRGRSISWKRHGLELIVIVFGIMISFLLNEWRQTIRDSDREQRLLRDLHADLRQDSIAIQDEIADLNKIIERTKRLHQHRSKPIPLDSVVNTLGPALSYSVIPFHQVTYREMLATGNASLLRDEELLREIMQLYERHYFMIRELGDIDERLVLDRMFPAANQQVLFEEPDTASMNALMSDVEWRNLLNLSLFFKSRIITQLQEQLTRIAGIQQRIEERLEKTDR